MKMQRVGRDAGLSMAANARWFSKQPLSGRRVLVVEDEMLVLMHTEGMLYKLGCWSVTAAGTTSQAIGFIRTKLFDAALLDRNLNGENSYEIADALSAREVPFAFATSYGGAGLRNADCGHPVLTKPYGITELSRTLSGLLVS